MSLLSLCLFCSLHELATSIVVYVSRMEPTVGLLMQLDRLVQLIESPVFVHVRLQLLESKKYPHLLTTLYGFVKLSSISPLMHTCRILALLPQSTCFQTLKTRLDSMSTHAMLPPTISPSDLLPAAVSHLSPEPLLDITNMLQQMDQVQQKHARRRIREFAEHSLLRK